jgi:hypothetical protein
MPNEIYHAIAEKLAEQHLEGTTGEEVYLSPAPDEKKIRVVEVTAMASGASEILPFRYKAEPGQGVPFAVTVILLTPGDFDSLRTGEIELPSH